MSILEIRSSTYDGPNAEHSKNWDEMTVLTTRGGLFRFMTGYVPAGYEGVKHDGGPRVPGPWAYAFGLATAICKNPEMGTGAERKRRLKAGTEHEVCDGQLIRIDGIIYEIKTLRNGEFLNLELYEA